MTKRTIPDTISEEEIVEILKHTKNPQHRAAFYLGFYQGMRVSEVAKLTQENIDKQSHLIKIKQAKGSKDRHIPIVKPILLSNNTIFQILKQIPIKIGIRAIQYAFKNKAKRVLKKDIHFHTLRHSGATWLLNKKKWDIRQVQRFLGHSKIQTTEIYTHVSPEDLINLEWGEPK